MSANACPARVERSALTLDMKRSALTLDMKRSALTLRMKRSALTASVKQSGFTLIEVLAALMIVALGMLGVITAVGQTASNSIYMRDKTIAHWVAMNRLTEARLQRTAPKVDKTSDEVEMGGRKWRWTMTVTQTAVETLRRIDVSVRPAEADEKSSMAFVSGFYGAAIAPPGSTNIAWQGDLGAGQGRGRDDDDAQRPPKEEPPPPDDDSSDVGDPEAPPEEPPPDETLEN